MNEKVSEFGLTDTFCMNPSGLLIAGQYTTPKDMAMIACEYRKVEHLNNIWKVQNHDLRIEKKDGSIRKLNVVSTFTYANDRTYEGHKTGSLGDMGNVVFFVRLPYDYLAVVVLMGGEKDEMRNRDIMKSSDILFHNFRYIPERNGIFENLI